MKSKKLIIVGTGALGKLAKYYFTKDSIYDVMAFGSDRHLITIPHFENLPVVAIEDLEALYPPSEFDAFVAIGYKQMNKVRERIYHNIESKGYYLANYISTNATFMTEEPIGKNNFIMECNIIQPFVKIGNNNVFFSSNYIGHEAIIEDNCYISSNVVIAGFAQIKSNTFLGLNVTIRDGITINRECLIGAGALITKDTVEMGVYVPPSTKLLAARSDLVDF